MTVRELIELNQMITDVQITVRINGTLLLDELNIGPAEGEKPPYPTRVPRERRWAGSMSSHDEHRYRDAAYIPKSINAWDDGQDYWQVKPNKIPAKWLNLQVVSWDSHPASTVGTTSPRRGGMHKNVNFHGEAIRITVLPSGEKLEVEEPKPKQKQDDDQLDGQMSIEDWDFE